MTINTPGQPIYVIDLTYWDGSTDLLGPDQTVSWTGMAGVATSVEYSFSVSNKFPEGTFPNDSLFQITELTTNYREEIIKIFNTISKYANITFNKNDSDPELVMFFSGALTTEQKGLTLPKPNIGSLITEVEILYAHPQGNQNQHTIIHETLHSLGLSHPHQDPFDTRYDQSTTTMSYLPHDILSASKPFTPMIYDIATIQFLYGANRTHNSGDDNYDQDFDNDLINGSAKLVTVWDAGGIDTFDLSWYNGSTGVLIDLRGGLDEYDKPYLSKVGDELIAIALDPLNPSGVVDIENAHGSQLLGDTIIGNDLNNIILGDGGDDSLKGGKGADKIIGGHGIDTIYADEGNDILDGDWDDVVIERTSGTPTGENDDYMDGGAGADTLYGGTGDDVLYGGADVDAFHNDGGIDRIRDHQTDEHLYLNGVLINGQPLTGMTDRPGFYEDSQGYQYRWYHDNRLEIRDGRDDGFNLRATPDDLDLILLPAPGGVRQKSRQNNGRNARKNHNSKLDFLPTSAYRLDRGNGAGRTQ